VGKEVNRGAPLSSCVRGVTRRIMNLEEFGEQAGICYAAAIPF
jgi:hypothetical protein